MLARISLVFLFYSFVASLIRLGPFGSELPNRFSKPPFEAAAQALFHSPTTLEQPSDGGETQVLIPLVFGPTKPNFVLHRAAGRRGNSEEGNEEGKEGKGVRGDNLRESKAEN